jgi:dTDP-4-dehydrorhamnose 3,5-epimerase-like enzyme
MNNLLDVMDIIPLQCNVAENGELSVVESGKEIPFGVTRAFFVKGAAGAVRGKHAHRVCNQFLICISGRIKVTCSDESDVRVFELINSYQGLLIPAGIWAEQVYCEDNSILVVLCDKEYEPKDYIRNFDEYLGYRQKFFK